MSINFGRTLDEQTDQILSNSIDRWYTIIAMPIGEGCLCGAGAHLYVRYVQMIQMYRYFSGPYRDTVTDKLAQTGGGQAF